MFRKMDSTSPLYRLYYDFYIFQNENEEQADFFASTIEDVFTSIGEHNITTLCMNLNDGIGDYVSQIYFIEKLNKLFQTVDNVKIKNISFVSSEKQPIAKIVRDKKIPEEDVLVLSETNHVDIVMKNNFIGVPNEKQKKEIEKVLQGSDFIFNLALELRVESSSFILGKDYRFTPLEFEFKLPKTSAMITSWTQYDFDEDIWKYNEWAKSLIKNKQNHDYSGPIFVESSMGIKSNNVGIRFIDSILDSGGIDKSDTLKSFSKEFSERLLSNIDSEAGKDYIEQNSFAGGYLQRVTDTLQFALFACQTTLKQGDMNLLVNISHFEHIQSGALIKFALEGFTHIELPGRIIPLSDDSRPKKKRILRLFDFKGISEENKARYRVCDIVAASGDTSFSETISSSLVDNNQILPFFRGWHTGKGPLNVMLEELPYKIYSYSKLIHNPGNVYIDRPFDTSNKITYMVLFADGTRYEGVIYSHEREFPVSYNAFMRREPSESKILLEYLSKKTDQNLTNFKVLNLHIYMKSKGVYIECAEMGLRCVFRSQMRVNLDEIISWDDLPSSFPRNTSTIFENKNYYFPMIINALVKKNYLHQYKILDMGKKEPIENYYKLEKYLNLMTEPSKEDIKFVRENRVAIASAWGSYCHYLNKTKNENNYFRQLMVTYTFHHLLKNNLVVVGNSKQVWMVFAQ